MNTSAFLEALKKAIRASLATLRAEHPSEPLAGFVLITDDDLRTVSVMAITKQALTTSRDPDLLFVPVNWPLEPEDPAFNELSKELFAAADATSDDESFAKHVDSSFAILVDALAAIRDEGLFSPATYLSVLSSDPSDHLVALAAKAIARLNEAGLVEAHDRFLKKWNVYVEAE